MADDELTGRQGESQPSDEAEPQLATPPILEQVMGAEHEFLAHRQSHADDVESAVRVFLEMLRGLEYMDLDRPTVTVFGSARIPRDHPYYELARSVGFALAQAGFAVMTGAGPGLMEAANRGAKEAGGLSVGANILLPKEQSPNAYLDRYVEFEHFFVRKVMLVKHSCAFIFLPGGFGTLDEVFETLTLMQTGKIEAFPMVGMVSAFWHELQDFIDGALVPAGTIDSKDLDLMKFTDSVDDAIDYILTHERGCSRHTG